MKEPQCRKGFILFILLGRVGDCSWCNEWGIDGNDVTVAWLFSHRVKKNRPLFSSRTSSDVHVCLLDKYWKAMPAPRCESPRSLSRQPTTYPTFFPVYSKEPLPVHTSRSTFASESFRTIFFFLLLPTVVLQFAVLATVCHDLSSTFNGMFQFIVHSTTVLLVY